MKGYDADEILKLSAARRIQFNQRLKRTGVRPRVSAEWRWVPAAQPQNVRVQPHKLP
jgi:hypothetical protein